ncbi:phosphatase PAP2 family protein [Halalkalibacter krulwichiae]|uniref:phosphatase PAP2 family protein n=1 Tax=Halalkalibacter krulwichiae TaxID=199441 RepID=UPI000825BD65|nr:phosphatase PAP2 family protein [Halalkalibacter krulwichiae]
MRGKNRYLNISIACLLLFIITAELVKLGATHAVDLFIREIITDASIILSFMKVMTEIGSSEAILLVTILLLVWLWLMSERTLFWFFSLLSAGGVLLNFGLKLLYQRERPGEEREIEVFGSSLDLISYSFPSGHTMRSVILFLFVIYVTKCLTKKWIAELVFIVSIFLIISIPLSRVVLDVHYTSDIVAAIFISISWFYVCLFLFEKKFSNYGTKKTN